MDRAAGQRPQIEQSARATQVRAEAPVKPLAPERTVPKEPPPAAGETATGAAEAAASLANAAFGQAGAQPSPAAGPEIKPPDPVAPLDAEGVELPANPAAEDKIVAIADRAQELRERGAHLRRMAAEQRGNAAILRGNLALIKGGIGQADEGIAKSSDHTRARREIVGQATQALGASEQKAAKVAQEAPGLVAKADEGKGESGPMTSEARSTASENASKTPDDPEAAGKSRQQGEKINKVSSDSASMDDAISQTRGRAQSLEGEAAQAKAMNDQTRDRITQGNQDLDRADQRLGQMRQQAGQARAQAAGASRQPEMVTQKADALDRQGQSLIQASAELEGRLRQSQRRYEEGMSRVPPLRPWEGEPPAEEGGEGEPTVQRTPEAGYEDRESVDLLQETPPWITGVDPPSVEVREQARVAEEQRREKEIAQIDRWTGGRFENASAATKVGIALRLTGQNYARTIANIKWPGWGGLAKALLDPRSSLAGVVSGLSQMLSGGANLFSAEQWKKDPVGNLLKSAADIATGLTIVLGSITLLAGLIAVIMAGIILLSLGFAAPVAGPILAFCAEIAITVGGWTIAVGKIALILQALVLIKNLIEAATAQSAEELQKESDQVRTDINSGLQVTLQIVGAKGAQVGARGLSNKLGLFQRAAPRVGGAGALRIVGRATARDLRQQVAALAALPRKAARAPRQVWDRFRDWLRGGARRGAPDMEPPAPPRPREIEGPRRPGEPGPHGEGPGPTQELSPAAIKELNDRLGSEALKKLSADLKGNAIKQLAQDLGDDVLKKLSADLSGREIKQVVDDLGAELVKHLGQGLTGKELKDLVTQLSAETLKQIGKRLTAAEIRDFVQKLSVAAVKELAQKYGGKAMKHYGPDFFKSYKGVTDDTMNHLLRNDGISGGAIKGCHDAATFTNELAGKGRVLSSTPHPSRSDIVRHEYNLFRRKSDGSLDLDAAGNPILSSGRPKAKTVIDDLASKVDEWKERFSKAADDAIKNLQLPKGGGGFSGNADGVSFSGFFRDNEIKTIFPDF